MTSAVAFLGTFLLLRALALVCGSTDSPDVSALNVMYSSLNSPSSLTGWTSSGGDPCGRHWRGIKCSGSSVTEIKLSGLGLTGSMGYQLSSLTSVKFLDLSRNNLQGDIPYQLPPNAVHINLAQNRLSGGVPYSVSQMTDLQYLNLGDNELNGQLTDMFGKLPSLRVLDLANNQLTGDLPGTLASLSSLETLHLQNNQLTGSIDVLAGLPLVSLNVENNHFSGWVPEELKGIDDLQTGGNSWSSGPAPPGPNRRGNRKNSSQGGSSGGLSGVAIAGIAIAVFVGGLVIFRLAKPRKSSSYYIDEENAAHGRSFTYFDSNKFKGDASKDLTLAAPMAGDAHTKRLSTSSSGRRPPDSVRHHRSDDESPKKFHSKRSTDPIDVTAYPLMDLQTATASFSSSRIVGQGSCGHVYKAKYADGKVLAVKRIDSSHLRSEDFKSLVAGICRLRHPHLTELLGYCCESSHYLLVYEFQKNGSLHEFLHLSDEYSKPLTWDTRVKIALGTARAVEYLHETCSPPVVHKNIKSANVLLSGELNPHLTDCGLGVLYPDTKRNLGPGYNPPECSSPAAYTLKSDVYSFGVVMLELLTGRMPFDSSRASLEQSLASWAIPQLHDIDALAKMVDPALRGLYPPKSLSRFADVIALCVQSEPEFRPPMSEVVQALLCCVQRRSWARRGAGDSDYHD